MAGATGDTRAVLGLVFPGIAAAARHREKKKMGVVANAVARGAALPTPSAAKQALQLADPRDWRAGVADLARWLAAERGPAGTARRPVEAA